MRFLTSVFVAAILAATQASAEPEEIGFSDLVDPLAVVFDDPYRDMGFRLLNELKLLVELDQKLSQNDLAEEERARLTARRKAAKDMLEINGQDVDALLAQRWDVARKRQTARMATNPVLNGVEVALSGYLIPAPQAPDGRYFGRHALPFSNAGRLFPRVARRVDQQHGFRDGLCGILYGGMVQGARRCDPG